MQNRREVLASAAAAACLPAIRPLPAEAAADRVREAFEAALRRDSRWLGWRGTDTDQLAGTTRIEGRMPEGLRGVLYRNGPAVHDRFGLRYHHWFEGDGMVQAFRLDDGGVTHRGRVVQTPKLRRERAAGKRLAGGFATPIADAPVLAQPDALNSASISVLDHHGELLALWEGGSASRLERATLDWSGFKDWGGGTAGLPFTAHPKVAPDGSLWAFGYNLFPRPALVLYHIAADGTLVKAAVVDPGPLGMVHDFVLTRAHMVLVIPPYVFEHRDGGLILDDHVWRPELGTRVLVVARDDFADRRWYQLPPGFGFHHGNGWEEADGTIRFDHCVAPNPAQLRDGMRQLMRGEMVHQTQERYTRFVLRPGGSAGVEEVGSVAEFPRVADSRIGHRNRFVYLLGAQDGSWWFDRILKQDLDRGTQDAHHYPSSQIPEEHVFVPRPGAQAEDDGWLLGPVLDHRAGVTGLEVLDARRVSDGPLAVAWLDYPLPLGFHGWFSPA